MCPTVRDQASGDESKQPRSLGLTTSGENAPPSSPELQGLRVSLLLLQMPFTSPGTDPTHVGDFLIFIHRVPSPAVPPGNSFLHNRAPQSGHLDSDTTFSENNNATFRTHSTRPTITLLLIKTNVDTYDSMNYSSRVSRTCCLDTELLSLTNNDEPVTGSHPTLALVSRIKRKDKLIL